jgi:hypothetical protein
LDADKAATTTPIIPTTRAAISPLVRLVLAFPSVDLFESVCDIKLAFTISKKEKVKESIVAQAYHFGVSVIDLFCLADWLTPHDLVAATERSDETMDSCLTTTNLTPENGRGLLQNA